MQPPWLWKYQGEPTEQPVFKKDVRSLVMFIEDLVSDAHSDEYIVAVAMSTRWRTQVDELRKKLIKIRRFLKRKQNVEYPN